jgi:hypothetical protein
MTTAATVKKVPVAKPFFGPEEEQAVVEVLRNGWVSQGPRVAEFEQKFSEYVGAAHAVAPTSGRHCVITRSPLTGCQTTAHAGGFWGTMLKLAGYDGIIIRGKASRPVYLFIDEGEAQLLDAGSLWGHDVFQTDALIKDELNDKKVSVTAIGPAGENQVPYASMGLAQQRGLLLLPKDYRTMAQRFMFFFQNLPKTKPLAVKIPI